MPLTPSQFARIGRVGRRVLRGGLQVGRGLRHHRRAKRIVFSERQWEFVRSLIQLSARGRVPHFPYRRHRQKFRW